MRISEFGFRILFRIPCLPAGRRNLHSEKRRGVRRMKKWFILIGVIAIFLIGGYFVLSFYTVKFIQARLQKVVGPGLTVCEIKAKPTYLSAKGIQYEDPLSQKRIFLIEEMRVYPALSSFLKGTLTIRECRILQPSFFFYRSQEGSFIGPWTTLEEKEQGQEISDERGRKWKEPVFIKIGLIRIQRGAIHFEDRKMEEPPAQIRLRNLDVNIRNVQYPIISAHSSVELKGEVEGKTKKGQVYTKGWIDLKTADMEISLKVQEIEVKAFEPYYRKRVSAEIETGYIDMDAKIAVKKKEIDAPGHLELVHLRIKEGSGTVLWIPAETLASLLRDKGDRIKVAFHVKGNMDDPQFSLQEAFLTRVALSLAETLGIPIRVVGETIIGGAGKGAEGLIEGLKSIEKLFKRKKEK